MSLFMMLLMMMSTCENAVGDSFGDYGDEEAGCHAVNMHAQVSQPFPFPFFCTASTCPRNSIDDNSDGGHVGSIMTKTVIMTMAITMNMMVMGLAAMTMMVMMMMMMLRKTDMIMIMVTTVVIMMMMKIVMMKLKRARW